MAKKRRKKKQKSVAGRILKVVLLTILSVIALVAVVGIGAFIGLVNSTPEIDVSQVAPDEYPSTIYDRNGNVIIELSTDGSNREEATYDELPENLKNAFIAIEDERFYEHNGIDLRGILRAIYVDLKEGKSEGASTITQQLIKNNVLETGGRERSTGSTLKRKVQEWVMSVALEKQMSKEEILTNYLNTIALGAGNYGVKTAAKYYFGKELDELTLSECAVIAAITKNPYGNNPINFPDNNEARQKVVLSNMLEQGLISQSEYNAAVADNPYERLIGDSGEDGVVYSYFIDSLIDDVIDDLIEEGYTSNQAYNLLYSGGLSIYTTQDPDMQAIIDEEVNNPYNYPMETTYGISWNISIQKADGTMVHYNEQHIKKYHWNDLGEDDYKLNFYTTEDADAEVASFKETLLEDGDRITYETIVYTLQPQISFTVMDYTTGEVLALTGGRGEKVYNLSMNRATGTTRQPGSTFKILASFAPAMNEAGFTLASVEDDSPFEYGGNIDREIKNWWGDTYRGLSNIRDAIRDSMNIVAVKVMYEMGASLGVKYLQEFGFEHIDPYEDASLATALGGITEGVTNLELCAAYSAIANQGTYIEPTLYTRILKRDGTVLLGDNQETRDVIRPQVAWLLTDAMQDCVTSGTGYACRLYNSALAGKTGTTSNAYDVWFAGYIPTGLCATIWGGYDENLEIVDDQFHKEMYSTIMNRIVDELGYGGSWSFPMPDGIYGTYVCHKSGQYDNGSCTADPSGIGVYYEYFENGTGPSTYCTVHTTAYICSETGLLATQYCPGEYRSCIIRPYDIKGGEPKGETADTEYELPTEYCTQHSAYSYYTEESLEEKDEDYWDELWLSTSVSDDNY